MIFKSIKSSLILSFSFTYIITMSLWFEMFFINHILSQISQYTLYSSSPGQYITSHFLLSPSYYLNKIIWNRTDHFINVIKSDPQVQVKIKDMLDKYNRLPYIYQSKRGYDTLIQNVILKEIINLMGTTIVGIDVGLKMKLSRIKN